MLRDKPFVEWSYETRKQLYDQIVQKITEVYPIVKPTDVNQIIIVGSRAFQLKNSNKLLFNPYSSDLDTLAVITTEKFIEICQQRPDCKYPLSPRSNIGAPKVRLRFRKIFVPVFLIPDDTDPVYYLNWQLYGYDLLTLKMFGKYDIDFLDYLLHAKQRLNPYEYCFICETEIKSPDDAYYVTYNITNKHTDIHAGFTICKGCYNKLVNGDRFSFVRILRKQVQEEQ